MPFYRVDVVTRLRELAAHLVELKHRVRRAVASETGRAVADAVKDLVVAVLDGTVCRDPYRPQYYDNEHNEWDDDTEQYDSPTTSRHDRGDFCRAGPSPGWLAALQRTAAAVNGWAGRKLPRWAATAVGVVVTTAAAVGEPLFRVGLAVADLL